MIGVVMRGGEDIQRHEQGYRPCQDAGKDGREPATRQRIPRIARSYQELERGREGFFPRAFRGRMALRNSDIYPPEL